MAAAPSGTGPCTMLCAQGRKNCAAGCCACGDDTIPGPTPGLTPGIVVPPVAASSTCGTVTVNGKTRYFSSNALPFTGLREIATLAFSRFVGTITLFFTLLFAWISFKTEGALHWITFIISLFSLLITCKMVYDWYKAKRFLDKNLKDTCDAPVTVTSSS